MKRTLLIVLAALVLSPVAQGHPLPRPKSMTLAEQKAFQVRSVAHAQGTVRFFKKHPRLARTPLGRYAAWWHAKALRWLKRELAQTVRFLIRLLVPHYDAWLCIHRYEGAWNDPNPPYFGGLQMDIGFQRAYGPELLRRKGTADNWTPLEQMLVAERAHRSRGFHPWPNTARYCGLL